MIRTLPLFARIFGAMVLMVIAGSWTFGSVLSVYQDRATAAALAPLWAATIRAAVMAGAPAAAAVDGPAAGRRQDVSIPVELRLGEPAAGAYPITRDGRIVPLVAALETLGIDVHDVRLEDDRDPPVTWLELRSITNVPTTGSRWIGIVGGVQPKDFRLRLWLGIAALLLLTFATSWWVSRWVARPLQRLVAQVVVIARGEAPGPQVRGPREIEQLGAAIASMAQQRAAFDDQRRTMLMGVSHDLRSPLTRIRVAADLIEDGAAGAKLSDLIVRNVDQADSIIASFSDYVRADAEPVTARVDLAAVVRSAARLALPAEQVKVGTEPVFVRGNAVLLGRLVTNLVDNALLHGAEPVEVSLRVDAGRHRATVDVEDAGPGITDPDRMLLPFERGDAARHNAGSGLGLAIVQRVVDRHGGTLVIDASPLGGARVSVGLPLAATGEG